MSIAPMPATGVPLSRIAIHIALRAALFTVLGAVAFAALGFIFGAACAVGVTYIASGSSDYLQLAAAIGGRIAADTGACGGAGAFFLIAMRPFPPRLNRPIFLAALRTGALGCCAGLACGAITGAVNGAGLHGLGWQAALERLPLSHYVLSGDQLMGSALRGALNGLAVGFFLGLFIGAWRGASRVISNAR